MNSPTVEIPFELSTKSTLAPIYWPLMLLDDHKAEFCLICGRAKPLNDHHIVFRSAGNLIKLDGTVVPKPVITLCGFGNIEGDADGNFYCHGKAHNGLLFFRNNDQVLEFLDLTSPEFWSESEKTFHEVSYLEALSMNGWRPVYGY